MATKKLNLTETHALEIVVIEVLLMLDSYFQGNEAWKSPRVGIKIHTYLNQSKTDKGVKVTGAQVCIFPVNWPKGDHINLRFENDPTYGWVPVHGNISATRLHQWEEYDQLGTLILKFKNGPNFEMWVGGMKRQHGSIKSFRARKQNDDH